MDYLIAQEVVKLRIEMGTISHQATLPEVIKLCLERNWIFSDFGAGRIQGSNCRDCSFETSVTICPCPRRGTGQHFCHRSHDSSGLCP
ncbi:hypothetical protein PL11201_670008 [Planktothrix sp. PCC 11201]|nr:hypothetical protein PL11201_670008 [Planktothrix sp. PCC 11201]